MKVAFVEKQIWNGLLILLQKFPFINDYLLKYSILMIDVSSMHAYTNYS